MSSEPQQIFPDGQSVLSSHSIESASKHDVMPEGSQVYSGLPLSLKEAQQTCAAGVHETFAPAALVPQPIPPVGGGGGGGGGSPASLVPPEELVVEPLLELLLLLLDEVEDPDVAPPLDPSEPAVVSSAGRVPDCAEAGSEKSSVVLAPVQATARTRESEEPRSKRSFIRRQD